MPRFQKIILLATDLKKAAVIDIGCGVLKAGLCGEVRPSCYCPSVIGVPRRFSQDISKMKKAYYVGDEAWTVAGMLQIGKHVLRVSSLAVSESREVCLKIITFNG